MEDVHLLRYEHSLGDIHDIGGCIIINMYFITYEVGFQYMRAQDSAEREHSC